MFLLFQEEHMSNLSFFTPVSFGVSPKTFSESLLQSCDNYLSLRGEKAYVVKGSVDNKRKVVLFDDNNSSTNRKTVLKVISYFFIVLPALAFIGKIILRATHSFHVIDVEKELSGGFESSLKDTFQDKLKAEPKAKLKGHPKAKLKADLNKIDLSSLASMKEGDKKGEITLCNREGRMSPISAIYTFTHSSWEGYIFRTAELRMTSLLSAMIKAKKICLIYNLDRLVIPNIKVFKKVSKDDKETYIIAETTSSDKKDIKEQLKSLTDLKSIEQLAVFLIKSHFYISEKNIALNNDKEKDRSISLFNLEEDFWYNYTHVSDLIEFLGTKEQIDAVAKIALQHGLVCDEETIKKRKNTLAQLKIQADMANRKSA